MKVRDYVRTNKGYIFQVININDCREPSMKYGVEASYVKDVGFLGDEDIIKSSPNIIDLIEVGDIINFGYVYTQTKEVKNIKVHRIKNEADLTLQKFYFNNKKRVLKSIVTKEQFESMEYKI